VYSGACRDPLDIEQPFASLGCLYWRVSKEGVAVSTEGALRAAFQHHYLSLVRLCVLLDGRRAEAEDIAQEAFVRLAPKIEEISVDAVGPYLRRIAINVWKNRRRRVAAELRARIRGWNRPDDAGQTLEQRDAVWRLVLQLPLRQRACVVLRYYEALSERDVASVLGCSVGTVKSQTSRALARLRNEFSDED
jgi:RNA polymerase sigma-70 factor (sigma-E family)